jgi:hypothetical protein
LLRDVLDVELPVFSEARVDSANLTDVQPAEYRADLVLVLQLPDDTPVLAIVVEVQLSAEERKEFTWPAYVANLRARLECPVCLLIVTADEAVARWAAKPIEMGAGNQFVPVVPSPSSVPTVTNVAEAQAHPELAVLSTISHGRNADPQKSATIALAARSAISGLKEDHACLYLDLIMMSLSDPVRGVLQAMDLAKYEYQSEFARRYFSQGKSQGIEQGEARGRGALIVRLLTRRFGTLSEEARARIGAASIAELDEIGERLLTAGSLQEALGSP